MTGAAETGDFTSPDDMEVSQGVVIVGDDVATAYMSNLAADETAICLSERNREIIEVGLRESPDAGEFTIGDVTTGRLNLEPAADEVVGYRVTVPVETQGFQVDLFIDIIAIRSGGALSAIQTQSVFSPFPIEQTTELVDLVAGRLP